MTKRFLTMSLLFWLGQQYSLQNKGNPEQARSKQQVRPNQKRFDQNL